MVQPGAEVVVDEGLVRRLLRSGAPDRVGDDLSFVGEGWDNSVWRLGTDAVVRVPRRAIGARLMENELRWLALVVEGVELATPAPLRRGEPTDEYPWPWSIGRWVEGRPGDVAGDPTSGKSAARLGVFFARVHRPAPLDAPVNPLRGVALRERTATFLEHVGDARDAERVSRAWRRASGAPPWHGAPVWLHGDPHPANTVWRDGVVAGVVDFGDLGRGDPATDLAGGLLAFDAERVDVFLDAYGAIDESLLLRSAGWALYYGVVLGAAGEVDRPTYRVIGERALANALSVLEAC